MYCAAGWSSPGSAPGKLLFEQRKMAATSSSSMAGIYLHLWPDAWLNRIPCVDICARFGPHSHCIIVVSGEWRGLNNFALRRGAERADLFVIIRDRDICNSNMCALDCGTWATITSVGVNLIDSFTKNNGIV